MSSAQLVVEEPIAVVGEGLWIGLVELEAVLEAVVDCWVVGDEELAAVVSLESISSSSDSVRSIICSFLYCLSLCSAHAKREVKTTYFSE